MLMGSRDTPKEVAQILVFQVAGETYGLDINVVVEVIRPQALRALR